MILKGLFGKNGVQNGVIPGFLMTLGLFTSLALGQTPNVAQSSETKAPSMTVQSVELKESAQAWDLRAGQRDLTTVREVNPQETETLNYLLFLPQNKAQKTDAGFPLILFLHGMGERGANPWDVAKIGLPALLITPSVAESFPFIVVSPQCPDKKCWSAKQLSEFLDKILEAYPVDKTRVYVTGLSMGGFGTWALMAERPEAFAAGMPVCGGGNPKYAEKLTEIPIWAFHGDADPVVPPSMTSTMVEAVQKAGGTKIRQTVFMRVSHNAWDYVYCNPDVYAWLLQHSRTGNGPANP